MPTPFGDVLRAERNRQGLTLRELAQRCGTNYTHLSRLESGSADRVPSRDLLDRLVAALDDPVSSAAISLAAERLPAEAERAVSRFSRAISEPQLSDRTLPALRRLDAGVQAERLLTGAFRRAIAGDRVDPEALCRAAGMRPRVVTGSQEPATTFEDNDVVVVRDPSRPGDAGGAPRVRFLLAHAASHAARNERSCTFPRVGTHEESAAIDLAAHLLSPRNLLERALRTVTPVVDEDARDPWAPRTADRATAVAERLGVPGWIAVRRLADEALLDDDAVLLYSWESPS
ncbi:helix-turn-helix domain-containing protein [Amycolatopsis orientalis]|uniref:helix-turn-helix domain-containing protein n=1 Tax=Amycolatopsis orientalis TaxID=31958 RepID=UPI001378AD29|nr:helix-turn-helix transcriptional regulator [Amycolatopsis orientalis]